MIKKKVFGFMFVNILTCAFLFGQIKTSHASDSWIAEEIFKQIAELKLDNNLLRKEVDLLKTQLVQLKKGGAKNKNISKVSLDDDYILGKKNGLTQVAIVEFSDFECSFCRRHITQTLPKLKKNYIDTGKIQYVMRDFPLDFHLNAKSAAIAANCAGQQDAYWQMHEKLFNTKGSKGKPLYLQMAKQLMLDENKFTTCLDNPAQAKEIEDDLAYGASVGVSGTPAFFIGKLKDGHIIDATFISGAQSYDRFSRVIDSILN